MGSPRIILAGIGPKLEGLHWEFDKSLRLGRQGNLDLVLHDFTVERLHAEIKYSGLKWVLRDLADDNRYPTFVNGIPLEGGQHDLANQDLLQVGQVLLKVVALEAAPPDDLAVETRTVPMPTRVLPASAQASDRNDPRMAGPGGMEPAAGVIRTAVPGNLAPSFAELQIQATAQHSWDQALELVSLNEPKQLSGPGLLALLRANHHLSNLSSLDDLLKSILGDAIVSLNAQRGAILLVDPEIDQLVLKALSAPNLAAAKKGYSKTLVERCFRRGESLLCRDVRADQVLAAARSVQMGAMSSVLCTLLRTPRKRLGVLHLDRGPLQEPFTESDLYLADAVAASVAVGIECAQAVELQRDQFVQTVTTLARAVEMRDQYTGDHTRRVTDYALLLAEELKVDHAEKHQIQIGTPLHDIGKIGIDDAILRKPGKLTPGEFDAMKTHTVKGAAILERIGSLNPMIPIVRHHHERWDGSGYPDGLGREKIALTARIVAVADAFDAMTSQRPYRPAMPAQLAFLEILSKAGTHFDPSCVQAFMRLRSRIESMLRQSSKV
jgi:putative nucleotidyltransferase with HDIG domain